METLTLKYYLEREVYSVYREEEFLGYFLYFEIEKEWQNGLFEISGDIEKFTRL